MTERDDSSDPMSDLMELVSYPIFNPALVPVLIDGDTLHIRGGPWTGPVLTLEDENGDNLLERLVTEIDGDTHIEDLLAQFNPDEQADIARALIGLTDKNAIHDASDYDRNKAYHHAAITGIPDAERLSTTTVSVVNAGGIGSHIVADLLDFGLKEVRCLQPIDSARQPLERYQSDDSFIEIQGDLSETIPSSDFVVYAAHGNYPELEGRLNHLTNKHTIPWTMGRVLGYDGIVGPTVFPGETACLECFERRVLSNAPAPDKYRAVRTGKGPAKHNKRLAEVSLRPFDRMVAGMVSMDLLHLLSDGTGFTAGRAVLIESLGLSMHADRVLKAPRCDVCGPEPGSGSSPYLSLTDFEQYVHDSKGG